MGSDCNDIVIKWQDLGQVYLRVQEGKVTRGKEGAGGNLVTRTARSKGQRMMRTSWNVTLRQRKVSRERHLHNQTSYNRQWLKTMSKTSSEGKMHISQNIKCHLLLHRSHHNFITQMSV